MKYLKEFDKHAYYLAYAAGFNDTNTPNVSYCVEENEIHYIPYMPPIIDGHEYVDLGLPSGRLWAKTNVGASNETDYGLYFAWGDTQGYTAAQVGTDKNFSWEDYKYTNDEGSTMSKYNTTDGKIVLEASDDALVANWSENWRTPTQDEWSELNNNTDKELVTINDVVGYKFKNKSDGSKYIFLPATGYASNGVLNSAGTNIYCWTSNRFTAGYPGSEKQSFYVYNMNEHIMSSPDNRSKGCAIRGVVNE